MNGDEALTRLSGVNLSNQPVLSKETLDRSREPGSDEFLQMNTMEMVRSLYHGVSETEGIRTHDGCST